MTTSEMNALARQVLDLTAAKNIAYAERNKCVAFIAKAAIALGWRAWLGRHDPADLGWEDDWRNIVFVQLPSGQVSWHIHDSELPLFGGLDLSTTPWDGHDTEEKYRRLAAAFRKDGT